MAKRISIKSTHRPVLLTTPSKSKTLIIGGKIYEVNGEKWDEPYVAILPGGVITLDDIDWIDPSDMAVIHAEPRRVKVKSSDGTKTYTVNMWDTGGYTCDCDGFIYRKKCRHINEV